MAIFFGNNHMSSINDQFTIAALRKENEDLRAEVAKLRKALAEKTTPTKLVENVVKTDTGYTDELW